MDTLRPTKTQINVVQHYLEQEFPGQLQVTSWDKNMMAQVFVIAHGPMVRHIVVDLEFFQQCPDCAAALYNSELADYIHESLSPTRCFRVTWDDGALRIRSRPL